MPAWLNYVLISAPRNGTTGHTIDPSSGTNAVAGTPFTPTAGRLLVAVTASPGTDTTPDGWTLPTNGDAVNVAGLYVFHKTAAGSDTLATTHNASNLPAAFAIFEFAAGSTFTGVVRATDGTGSSANPTISSLTGTQQVFGAIGNLDHVTGEPKTIAWDGSNVELVELDIEDDVTDGILLGVCYQENYASATYAPTPTTTNHYFTSERLTFAVVAAAGETDPPENTVAPAITGTAEVGETLTCSTGTWDNSPTGYTYQWQRMG